MHHVWKYIYFSKSSSDNVLSVEENLYVVVMLQPGIYISIVFSNKPHSRVQGRMQNYPVEGIKSLKYIFNIKYFI